MFNSPSVHLALIPRIANGTQNCVLPGGSVDTIMKRDDGSEAWLLRAVPVLNREGLSVASCEVVQVIPEGV